MAWYCYLEAEHNNFCEWGVLMHMDKNGGLVALYSTQNKKRLTTAEPASLTQQWSVLAGECGLCWVCSVLNEPHCERGAERGTMSAGAVSLS